MDGQKKYQRIVYNDFARTITKKKIWRFQSNQQFDVIVVGSGS